MNFHKNIIKKLDIYNPNKHMQTPKETFKIGIAQFITGLVSIFTLGRYGSGLAANVIGDVIVTCIHKRDVRKEENDKRKDCEDENSI